MNSELVAIFNREGLRITKPRQAVFAVLYASTSPLQIGEIARRCKGVDRVSVYRTIDLFIHHAIVVSVPLGWKQQYELASPFKPHHHHIHCTKCGTLTDIDSPKLEQLIADIAAEHTFTVQMHKFEISGYCAQCASVTS